MRLRFDIKSVTVLGLLLAMTMGHGDGCCSDEASVLGPPTETECPPTSTLTYENFGQGFMQDFCTDCHATTKVGADRNGATEDHDFDILAGIRGVALHIDQTAGIGPASANRNMPPADEMEQPTDELRRQLAEWLACGAPSDP
jgi:uncharacterized membrane protein